MKSTTDIQNDLSTLYDQVVSGSLDLKRADTLRNIAHTNLKAAQLEFARQVFSRSAPLVTQPAQLRVA